MSSNKELSIHDLPAPSELASVDSLPSPSDLGFSPQVQEPGKLESALRGAEDYTTFGFGDELNAKLASLASGKTYEDELADSRAKFEAAKEANPITYHGSGILASLIPMGLVSKGVGGAAKLAQMALPAAEEAGTIGRGANWLAKAIETGATGEGNLSSLMAAGAAEGGTVGALTGAGSAENMEDIPKSMLEEAKTGAALGTAGGALLKGVQKVGEHVGQTEIAKDVMKSIRSGLADEDLSNPAVINAIAKENLETSQGVVNELNKNIKDIGSQYEGMTKNLGDIDVTDKILELRGKEGELSDTLKQLKTRIVETTDKNEARMLRKEAAQISNELSNIKSSAKYEPELEKLKQSFAEDLIKSENDPAKLQEVRANISTKMNKLNATGDSLFADKKEILSDLRNYLDNKLTQGTEDLRSSLVSQMMKENPELTANELAQMESKIAVENPSIKDINKQYADTIAPIKEVLGDTFREGATDANEELSSQAAKLANILKGELSKPGSDTSNKYAVIKQSIDKLKEIQPELAPKLDKLLANQDKLRLAGHYDKLNMSRTGRIHAAAYVGANKAGLMAKEIAESVPGKIAMETGKLSPNRLYSPEVAAKFSPDSTIGKMMRRLQDQSIAESKRRAYENILLNNPIVRNALTTRDE